MTRLGAMLILGAVLTGCNFSEADEDTTAAAPAEQTSAVQQAGMADPLGGDEPQLTAAELERGRMDPSWRRFVGDTTRGGAARSAERSRGNGNAGRTAAQSGESWDDISAESVRAEAIATPLAGDIAGPSVLGVQVLLDRAAFSPGLIDGRWGKNTESAVFWLQRSAGLPETGEVDGRTLEMLRQRAGSADALVREHTLSAEDVQGPFVELPADVYARAKLECLCYESLAEKLGERFHTSPEVLRQLNPDVDLNTLKAGGRLVAPQVRTGGAGAAGNIARIVISAGGHYLHALGADGRVLYHFPTTLGSEYAPSPSGDFRVTSISWDPTWHYQPALLTGEPDDKPDAVLPGGPNNAVGVVWMQLSKPHYGIHGTKAPETIGYATSHGCVRLTNWDARFLGERIEAGVPVEFRDTPAGQGAGSGA